MNPIKERDDDTYAVELPNKLSQVCSLYSLYNVLGLARAAVLKLGRTNKTRLRSSALRG